LVKKVNGTKELRDEFDTAIREMRKDGTINKIRKEFGIDDEK
jgi:ABC-type amino acid transport substrate-binding protein